MNNRIDAIYARQSVDKKDSISIESQIEFCKYELKGGNCKEYTDKGYSGKNTDRPKFQKLVRDIKRGLIAKVVVYNSCRSLPYSASERRTFSYEPYRCWISFFSLLLIVSVLVLLVLNCAGFSVTGVSVSGFTVYGFSVHGDSEHGFFLGIS